MRNVKSQNVFLFFLNKQQNSLDFMFQMNRSFELFKKKTSS